MSISLSGLNEGELRYLAIILKNRFTISSSEMEKQYGSKYVYEVEKRLINKGFIEKNKEITLTNQGIIPAIRSFMVLEEFSEKLCDPLAEEFNLVIKQLRKFRYNIRRIDQSKFFRDMLRVLGQMDELFKDLPILREMREGDYKRYVVGHVKTVLKNVFKDEKLFERVIRSWLKEYGLADSSGVLYQLSYNALDAILYHTSSYSYSKLKWYMKYLFPDLLIKILLILVIIGVSLIYLGVAVLPIIVEYLLSHS